MQYWFKVLLFLGLLLILPVRALLYLSTRNPYLSELQFLGAVGVCAFLVSLITFKTYQYDKKQAKAGAWRISENSLHLLELMGGWPGALLAQLRFRHKTAKSSFKFTYWMIVVLYQYTAFDLVQQFTWSRFFYTWVKGLVETHLLK